MKEKLYLQLARQLLLKPHKPGVLGGAELGLIAKAGDMERLREYLLNIAEQAADPRTRRTTIEAWGEDIVNVALKLQSLQGK